MTPAPTTSPAPPRGTRRPAPPTPVSGEPRRADHTAPQAPVFVDRTGRRRRLLACAGLAAVVLLVAVAVGLVLAVTGGGHGLLPGLPGAARTPVTGPGHAVQPGSASPGSAPSTAAAGSGHTGGTALQPSPAPNPTGGSSTSTAPSPSASTSHRHVPTQTPTHKK